MPPTHDLGVKTNKLVEIFVVKAAKATYSISFPEAWKKNTTCLYCLWLFFATFFDCGIALLIRFVKAESLHIQCLYSGVEDSNDIGRRIRSSMLYIDLGSIYIHGSYDKNHQALSVICERVVNQALALRRSRKLDIFGLLQYPRSYVSCHLI